MNISLANRRRHFRCQHLIFFQRISQILDVSLACFTIILDDGFVHCLTYFQRNTFCFVFFCRGDIFCNFSEHVFRKQVVYDKFKQFVFVAILEKKLLIIFDFSVITVSKRNIVTFVIVVSRIYRTLHFKKAMKKKYFDTRYCSWLTPFRCQWNKRWCDVEHGGSIKCHMKRVVKFNSNISTFFRRPSSHPYHTFNSIDAK